MGDLESNASLLAQTNASASSSGFESFSVNGSCEKDVLQAQMAILKDLKYVVEENRKNTFVNWPFEEKAKGTKRKLKIKCTVEAVSVTTTTKYYYIICSHANINIYIHLQRFIVDLIAYSNIEYI